MKSKVRLWRGGAREIVRLIVGAFLLLFPTVPAVAQVPQIIIQPESQGTVPGTTVVFSVTAGGPGPLSYQWMTNSVNISLATNSSYTISSVTTNNTADYTVKVSNSYGAVTSQVATLIVYLAPSIATQPLSQTNNQGSNVTFTVFATGTTPLSYQWSFDGTNIPGATLDGYVINNIQPADSGTYSVLVSNPAGSVNSANATLLVRVAPSITNQPQSQTVTQGQNVIFTVGASGTTPLTYQWRKNGGNISLATNSAYGITNVQGSQAGTYTIVVSNPAGTATSSNAVLIVNVPPSVTTQPQSQNIAVGNNVTFSVGVSGTSPFAYQWLTNSVPDPTGTNSSYSLMNVGFANAGSYVVVVTNIVGSVTSSPAILAVGNPPALTIQPQSQEIIQGQAAIFTAVATGTAPLNYQWFQETGGWIATLTGATNSNLIISNAQGLNSGTYTVTVFNLFGSKSSTNAVLTVDTPPVITAQPASMNVPVGGNAAFQVTATGASPLQYQWFNSGGGITNATNSTFAIAGVSVGNADSYYVVVTNFVASVTSIVAVLAVGYPPVITTNPVSQTNAVGGTVVFSGAATGSPPIALQWLNDGVPIAGATNGVLNLSNLAPGRIGYYALSASNAFGAAVSSNAALNLSGYGFGVWQGLVAYYPFDGNANDYSGNQLNFLTLPAFTNNQFAASESAASFATPGPITTTNISLGSNGFSVSLWIYLNRWPSQYGERVVILGATPLGGDNQGNDLFSVCVWGDGHGGIDVVDSSNQGHDVNAGPGSFTTNRWYQMIFTADGTNVNFFLNGTPAASLAASLNPINEPLTLGGDSGYYFVSGAVDDLRIYNRALSTNEVALLYTIEADVPVITQQPASRTVVEGDTATFSVGAVAVNGLTYQWFKDGVPLASCTNTFLTLTNIQPGQIGYYSVSVSNAVSGLLSTNASLDVAGYGFSQWQGLVGYYPFKGNANDATGIGRNGIVDGAVLAADRFGNQSNAYSFDGVSAEIVVNAGSGWPGVASPRTVSTWFLPTANQGDLFTFGDGTVTDSRFSILWSAPEFVGEWDDFPFARPSGTGWMQLIITYDGTNGIIYIDGAYWASFQKTSLDTDGTMPLVIGADSLTRNDEYFAGELDDIRVYNRVLSSTEVAALYALEVPHPIIELIGGGFGFVSGQFGFNIGGMSGETVVIQASTNLQTWIPIQTNTLETTPFYFSDPQSNTNFVRFYRVQIQ